jgi:hypothetical protein
MSGSDRGPIDKATHRRYADEAAQKRENTGNNSVANREKIDNLKNLERQHRNVADHGTPEPKAKK